MTVPFLIACCFLLSIFFSMAEMAFVSANRLKLRKLVREKKKEALIVQGFHRNPKQFLASVLIGNNLVNISFVVMVTYLFEKYLNVENQWLVTLVTAPFLIIFAETAPKDYGRQQANHVIYQIARPLQFVCRLFSPVTASILWLGDILLKIFRSYEKKSPFVTKEEFAFVIEESAKHGVITNEEKRLVGIILNFERIRVEEMMVPLREVPHIDITKNVWELKDIARRSKKPFVLVYEEIPSIIVGTIYIFDVLFERNENRPLGAFLKPPLFVFKDESAEKTFLKLQQNHQSFAVVLDENREAIGTVSIDDLLAF